MNKSAIIDGNYIARVTITDSPSGIGLTTGFSLNAEAYDALKDKHNFKLTSEGRFKHMSGTEYYRIDKLIKDYLKD